MKLPAFLGRYRLEEKIAKGGMAKVYRASDDLIGRNVAVKIVSFEDKNWSKTVQNIIKRQFEQEMRISGQLLHHNVVTIYDAGEQDSLFYLVMELLDGHTLSNVIKGKAPGFDTRQKLEFLIQVAHALHYAHQRGIVHRDIKPSNIMACSNGQVKVMDFGVAYAIEQSDLNLKDEQINIIGGTPYYMSPEQIVKGKVDGRSDLFSLAVVAYELLTGHRPFEAKTRKDLFDKIMREEPRHILDVNPEIPNNVGSLVMMCLRKNPELRLASCQAFADSLDEIVNDQFFASKGEAVTEETLETLRQYRESFSFFFDLDNSQIYRLLQVCQTVDFKEGDTIFTEGSIAREMFLVISGDVRIFKGHGKNETLVILTLQRGEVFGEMGVIDGGPRSANAVAETDCRLLALHQVSLIKCDDATSEKVYRNLSRILSSKLRITSARLDEYTQQSRL